MQKLVDRLVKGLETKARPDGSVTQIKAEGKTVAEVCRGKSSVRVNFRQRPKGAPKDMLAGASKTWEGGGVVITEENVGIVRTLIEEVAGTKPRRLREKGTAPATAPAPAAASPQRQEQEVRQPVAA
jgi:hypothetical protein